MFEVDIHSSRTKMSGARGPPPSSPSASSPEAGGDLPVPGVWTVLELEEALKTDHTRVPFNPLTEMLSAECFGEKGEGIKAGGSVRVSNVPTLSSWLSRPLL